MNTLRFERACHAYLERFPGAVLFEPFGVGDLARAEALERALAEGEPLSEDFDWWADLPPDAVA